MSQGIPLLCQNDFWWVFLVKWNDGTKCILFTKMLVKQGPSSSQGIMGRTKCRKCISQIIKVYFSDSKVFFPDSESVFIRVLKCMSLILKVYFWLLPSCISELLQVSGSKQVLAGWYLYYVFGIREGVQKTWLFLGLFPKLWVGGGQESGYSVNSKTVGVAGWGSHFFGPLP